MSFQRIMGIHVNDNTEYQLYRDAMRPILTLFGGTFGYDFKISEVLLSKTDSKINRVFTIDFPSESKMNDFFSNPDYIRVKEKHFNKSVSSTTIIGMHEVTN